VSHLRERYGDAETKTWMWEVWNEPDIAYWKGTPEEFFKLYDFSVDAILRAFPQARVGGPDSTGASYPKAAEFLSAFLEHCAHQKNYANGRIGTRLDFICFHPKGSPRWLGDHVQMGIARQLASIDEGVKIVASFPEWRQTPIILGESDPEGCAACPARDNPQNAYRNGELYATYTAEVLNSTFALAARAHTNVVGAVTWAFEFENQPYFAGFRELATNGIDKPVLNAFRMFSLLGSERISATSSAALPTDEIVRAGVRGQPDINAIATRKDHEVDILIWNYHDDDLAASDTIDLEISGLPVQKSHAQLEHFRIDSNHSNAFTMWKDLGAPQTPSAQQFQQIENAGRLQLLSSPSWLRIEHGTAHLQFTLPREGLSLIRIGWQ
jgi:xylan 1,4-beta-xylosidase